MRASKALGPLFHLFLTSLICSFDVVSLYLASMHFFLANQNILHPFLVIVSLRPFGVASLMRMH